MSKQEEFKLTAEEIKLNYVNLINRVNKLFPERSKEIIAMYKDLGIERVSMLPASSVEHYHNAIPGGYVDHVLRVMDFSAHEYRHAEKLGIDLSGFQLQELLFAAMHHDLGKVGLPGDGMEGYIFNDSEWHRNNLGKMYETNSNVPFAMVPDKSIYLLQSYGVKMTWNEYIGIRIHDGLYDEINKGYYFSNRVHSKQRTYMYQILHNADMYAARFEFERWNKFKNKLKTKAINTITDLIPEVDITPNTSNANNTKKSNLKDEFEKTFK